MCNQVSVPIGVLGLPRGAHGYIKFRYPERNNEGVIVPDVIRNPSGIHEPNKLVFPRPGAIHLRLAWPGYGLDGLTFKIHFPQLTKAELALQICQGIMSHFHKCKEVPAAKDKKKWRVGLGGISSEDVFLICIVEVSPGTWQAQMSVGE